MLDLEVRRTIEELVVLHDREPHLQEVYVEGISDQYLVQHYLDSCDVREVSVYSVEVLNIEFEKFCNFGWEDNNRSRVMYVAKALEEQCTNELSTHVVCVIDADFDFLLEKTYNFKLLLTTEFTSMEMYTFSISVLTKFFKVVLRTAAIEPSQTLEYLKKPLVEMFLIRAANQLMSLGIEPIKIEKACLISGNGIEFDHQDYLTRFLHKGRQVARREEVAAKIAELRTKLPSDLRQAIHGHDFFAVLYWYISKVACRIDSASFFGPSIMACLEPSDFSSTRLFPELKQRLSA